MSGPTSDAELGRAVLALVGDPGKRREPIRPEAIVEIAAIIVANPTISANAVAAQVTARRSEVLRIVKAIQTRAAMIPGSRYHLPDREGGVEGDGGDSRAGRRP